MRCRRARAGAARRALFVALMTGALTGCFADPTEVVVVVDTDAKVGRDFAEVQLCFSSGEESRADGLSWPVTVGARLEGSFTTMFTVQVRLNTTNGSAPCNSRGPMFPMVQTPPPFDTRTAMDVRFVNGEMRALFLPMLKACACIDASGMPITNCSHALDPDCRDLSNPQLAEFDEDNLPHLPASAKSP